MRPTSNAPSLHTLLLEGEWGCTHFWSLAYHTDSQTWCSLRNDILDKDFRIKLSKQDSDTKHITKETLITNSPHRKKHKVIQEHFTKFVGN